MPTGYTSFIQNKEITKASDFIKLCMRAFGVCVEFRDNGLSLDTPDFDKSLKDTFSYYEEGLKKLRRKKVEFLSATQEELKERYRNELEGSFKSNQEDLQNIIATNQQYKAIHEAILNWKCDDKALEIKKFALNQLEISIESTEYVEKRIAECRKNLQNIDETFETWKTNELKSIERDFEYYNKSIEEAIKSNEDRKNFYFSVLESAKSLDTLDN